MNDPELNLCAHVPCICSVAGNEKYCSDACRDAASGETEINCECGHSTCMMADAEEDVA